MSDARWRQVHIIGNPNSGMKGGLPTNRATVEEAVAALSRCGIAGEVTLANSTAQAAAAAREAVASGCDLVVAAGGDGTVGTVAQELLWSETALGLMPLGSVMNLARSLKLSRDLDAAAAIIAVGATRRIDIGEARGRVFFEAGSVGMNAAIFREVNRIDRGDWLGLLSSLWVALRYRRVRMTIHLDDRTIRTRALVITISNGPYTGLGFTVAPGARLDDGLFDVRIFRGFSRLELFQYFGAIAFGRRRYSPKITTLRSASVTVASAHPLAARADAHDL
ncbi:MAG TPA: diacylglycerol kinase family protein, partial [Thermomicrobiales bacterium]